MEQTTHCFVFIRTDIPLAQQIVQASHAALELGLRVSVFKDTPRTLILYQARSEDQLLDINDQCQEQRLTTYLFHEPDDYLGFQPSYTALATLGSLKTKKLFSKQKLWVVPVNEMLPQVVKPV